MLVTSFRASLWEGKCFLLGEEEEEIHGKREDSVVCLMSG